MLIDLLNALNANQQKLVLVSAVFVLYLVVIIGFAVAYYSYFLRNPSAFVFAANIAEGQRTNRLAELSEYLDWLDKNERVLIEASDELRDKPDQRLRRGNWELELPSGKVNYLAHFINTPHGAGISPVMVIETVDKKEYKDRHKWISHERWNREFTTIAILRKQLIAERLWVDKRRTETLRMHQSFQSGSPLIWRFADFAYFSTIIQSTVGLGDIQPNSTTVRTVVVFQILIGYAILIVLLNIILGWQWQTT